MPTTPDFGSVANEYRHRIYTFSHYYLRKGEDAEDVTQEVLVRLWKHLDSIDPEKLPAWVSRVTRNACVDLVRKRISYRNIVADDGFDTALALATTPAQNPAERLESKDMQNLVQDAIAELPEPYRSLLVMREIQQLSYNEITEALDMPLNTVKVYIHRGRRKLREQLTAPVANGVC